MFSKKILSNVLTFGFGELLNKLIPFILLPILTNYLSPEEYGYVAVYTAALAFLLILISLSSHANISVFFFKVDEVSFAKVVTNCVALSFVALTVIEISIYLLRDIINKILIAEWLGGLAFAAFFQSIGLFYLTILRVKGKIKSYITFQIVLTAINALLSLFLIIILSYGWEGRIWGLIIGIALVGLVALYQLYRYSLLSFSYLSKSAALKNIIFSAPLLVHALSSWVKTSLDKILLMGYLTAGVTGEYAVLYQICSTLLIFYMTLNQVLQPELFRVLKEKKTGYQIRLKQTIKLLVIGIIIVSVIFYQMLPHIYDFMIGEKYKYNGEISLLLVTAFGIQGVYFVFINFLYFNEETKSIGKYSLINGVSHIFIGLWLIPMYGTKGAAWLALLSTTQLTIFTLYTIYRKKLLPQEVINETKNDNY